VQEMDRLAESEGNEPQSWTLLWVFFNQIHQPSCVGEWVSPTFNPVGVPTKIIQVPHLLEMSDLKSQSESTLPSALSDARKNTS